MRKIQMLTLGLLLLVSDENRTMESEEVKNNATDGTHRLQTLNPTENQLNAALLYLNEAPHQTLGITEQTIEDANEGLR